MEVIKRNGERQTLSIDRIRKQTIPACEGLEGVDHNTLEFASSIRFKDGISTTDIQNALIKAAESSIALDAPNWMYVAARLRLYDLYHRIKHYYGITGEHKDGDVYEKVSIYDVVSKHPELYSDHIKSKYTKENFDELNKEIKSERDKLFTTAAVQTLTSRYLGVNGSETIELPQHMFMLIAMYAASVEETEEQRLEWAKAYYKELSTLRMIAATPINSNGRFDRGSTASCFLTSMTDTLESIFDTYKEVGFGSASGGGWGIDITRLRALGGKLRNRDNAASGPVPFVKILNDIALAVNQGGIRAGAFAVYLETWHINFPDFLDMCKRHGDERARGQDLFYAASISDLFMERVKTSGEWTLFDPTDVPELSETWGDEFKKHYLKAEDDFINNRRKFNINTKRISAKDLFGKMIYNWSTEGKLFWYFKDNTNKAHAYPESGIIRSLNLCTEIAQPTDENTTAVCNLGSLNLGQLDTISGINSTAAILTRFLDSIIDVTEYHSDRCRDTQLKHRSIGIGVIGEAEYVATRQIMFGSDKHEEFVDELYSNLSNTIKATSMDLAKEKGGCGADPNIRNAYRMAIAPNTSSGLLAGSTCSCEPIYAREWSENSKLGTYKMVAPHINLDNINYYKNAYELDQGRLIELTALRQKYIDMAISHSVYIDPNDYQGTGRPVTALDIAKLIVKAHSVGMKSLYYFRAKAKKNKDLDAVDKPKISCVGCEN